MEIVEQLLDALGVKHGDPLIVHSGVSNVGKIKGGGQPRPETLWSRLHEKS